MRYTRDARTAQIVGSLDDDWDFWGHSSPDEEEYLEVAEPSTGSHNGASQRFRRALAEGNPRQVRAAAAELPDIGVAEAAAILLVIERTEPENYELTALQWLAKLATEGHEVGLKDLAQAATALEALPHEPSVRAALAEVCLQAGLPEVASVFDADERGTLVSAEEPVGFASER
jgi:hypothetical protein